MKELNALLSGIFDDLPEDQKEKLNRIIGETVEEFKSKTEDILSSRERMSSRVPKAIIPPGAKRPLTLEEAEIIDERILLARASVERIFSKIDKAEQSILNSLQGKNGKPTFSLDISKKPKLKKAARKVFGQRVTEITFDMYREALEEKSILEKMDANSFFEEDDDDGISEEHE